MDLDHLRTHPAQLRAFLTHQRVRETPVPGGSICTATRLTLDDGAEVFAKTWPGDPTAPVPPPDGFFAAEAAGLDWLRQAGAVAVPEVICALPDLLALQWLDSAVPSAAAALRFGRELAALHRAGAAHFGTGRTGYIGSLPLPPETAGAGWGTWFARYRLAPYLERSARTGALTPGDVAAVDRLLARVAQYAGPAEPPARIHGDLWPGNLLWTADRVWLVDPAAQGGHRETDLATLHLFGGAPYLAEILAGYEREWPLAPGWRTRVPLHQLHLLLVHTALFGATYRDLAMSAVRDTVRG